jgi:hypothetical protein
MFTKIRLTFYNILFEIYGLIGRYYYRKGIAAGDGARKDRLKKKAWDIFDKRQDILDIMFTLKGL